MMPHKKYKDYPRLFSLSTIGIKNHYNIDYIFHPLRTDFIGDSGVGKSMIADLLQLIFVGHKFYISGTADHPKGEDRPISGMLHNEHDYAYAWLQIEKKEKQYFSIGVFLQKNSNEVTHFLVHSGQKKDEIECYTSFLHWEKFLKDERLFRLNDVGLRQHLASVGYKIHTYKNRSEYHKILIQNKVLPIELDTEEKVKIYANILQTFSRAKKISTESKDLKKFLFNQDEIGEHLANYKDIVNGLKDVYEANKSDQKNVDDLEKKYNKFKELEEKRNSYYSEYKRYMIEKIKYEDYEYQIAKSKEEKNGKEIDRLELQKLIVQKGEELQNNKKIKTELATFEQKALELFNHTILSNSSRAKEESLSQEKGRLEEKWTAKKGDYDKVVKIESLLSEFNTNVEGITVKFYKQKENQKHKKEVLEFEGMLKNNELISLFEDSAYFVDFDSALKNYTTKRDEIIENIRYCEAVIAFSDIEDTNSLVYWLLNEYKKPLSKEEESALLQFQVIMRNKPISIRKGSRFLPQPEDLLKAICFSLEDNNNLQSDGFWLNLAGVYEFITYKPNNEVYIFGEIGDKLNKEIAHLAQDAYNDMEISKLALVDLDNLHTILTSVTNTSYYISLYKKRGEINSYKESLSLNMSKEEFEGHIFVYQNPENAKKICEYYAEVNEDLDNIRKQIAKNSINLQNLEAKEKEIVELKLFLSNSSRHSLQASLDKSEEYINVKTKAIEAAAGLIFSIEKETNEIVNKNLSVATIEDTIKNTQTYKDTEKNNKETHFRNKTDDISTYRDFFKEVFEIELLEPEAYPEHKKPKNEPKNTYSSKQTDYYSEFKSIAKEYLENKYEAELLYAEYSFGVLTKQIFPPEVFKYDETIEEEYMNQVQQHIRELNEKNEGIRKDAWNKVPDFFGKVLNLYTTYEKQVMAIKDFFRKELASVSRNNKVRIDFKPHDIYKKSYLEKIQNNEGLFASFDSTQLDVNSQILSAIKKELTDIGIPLDIEKLINPFSYFDLEFTMENSKGEKNIGSTGQKFTKIALLCIAKMRVIETNYKNIIKLPLKEGVRFMPIDEAEGLGSNYQRLHEIAIEEDYQIISFTPGYLGYENQDQYVYELQEGDNDKNGHYFGTFYDQNIRELEYILQYHYGK